MKKGIAIIGPVYPYRGGIAHHTNMLVNSLVVQGIGVSVFSFSKQYPVKLYPGAHQKEPKGSKNPLSIVPVYTLDPLNPFTWFRTISLILKTESDTVLIKYWHPYFVPCYTFIAWFLRKKNKKIVCIVENLFPHERSILDLILIKLLFSQVDKTVTQSNIVSSEFHETFPIKSETMIDHPVYDQFGEKVGTLEARDYLSLPRDRTILLFFGFIRPYKGLDILLESVSIIIKNNPKVLLVIVGECFGSFDTYQEIIKKFCLENHVITHIKYVPSEDIRYWFGACDLLVMPYRTMTNSGIENIGKIYAKKSLLTLGVGSEELAHKIVKSLNEDTAQKHTIQSWEDYVEKLERFIYQSQQ